MGLLMDEEIKRWTARRKTALVLEIIQGKTTIAEASRAYDLPPSELESWVECADQVVVEAVDVASAAQRVGELVQLLAGAHDAGISEQAVPGGGGRGAQRTSQRLARRVRQRAQAAPQARTPQVAGGAAERIGVASQASPESATVTSRQAAWLDRQFFCSYSESNGDRVRP